MALSVQNFIKLANLYNQIVMVMSAVCVQKGGIAMENYAGRFFVADVLEYVYEYGRRLMAADKKSVPANVADVIKDLVSNMNRLKI